jgi:outer membrane protein
MFKRVIFFLLLNLICFGYVYSQQITRFAVVDLSRVYTAFFRESRAVREFEERSARVQSDIDRISREIQDLRSRHADAVLRDDQTEALRLENLIHRRSEFLRDFYQTRMAELEDQRRRLMQSSQFLNQVHDEIRFIAEREGLSMVINSRDNPSIVWFSPTVDITDRLIQSLQTRNRN